MTITHLDPYAAAAPAGVQGLVAGRTRIVHSVLDKIHVRLGEPGARVTTADIEEVERIARRVEAVRLALVAAADREQVHRRAGHTSTAAWVASATHTGGADAQRDVVLATALDAGLERTRTALQAGDMSGRSAGIIASTMGKLPEDLTSIEREKVEASLVRDARRMTPGKLRGAALVALAAAERTAEQVADHVEAQLLDEERRAYALASVTMHDQGNGTTRLSALLPTPAAKTLSKVLQSMTSPRRDHLRKGAEAALADGQTPAGCIDDGSVAAGLLASTLMPMPGSAQLGDGTRTALDTGAPVASQLAGRNADWASLDWAQRRGRALADLIEHLDTDKLTGKVASTVIVTMTLEQALAAAKTAQLQAEVKAATGTLVEMAPSSGAAATDTGTPISASAARRIACNAGILPAVLGGSSQVLDLGRQERFFTDHQRTALATIYDTCAADDCDRPYSWSELHHQDPWSRGGFTDLDRALPLCGYHHRRIHDPAYTHDISRNPDAPGVKTVHLRLRT